MNPSKLFEKALNAPAGLRFEELCVLAVSFGFRLVRVRGSHHIFMHPAVAGLLNLQNVGGKAKPYQVRQLLRLIERYNLSQGKVE